jgi:hypothetical protein
MRCLFVNGGQLHLTHIVTHGAAMMDAIHSVHGRFGFGGFLAIAHILIPLRSDLCG